MRIVYANNTISAACMRKVFIHSQIHKVVWLSNNLYFVLFFHSKNNNNLKIANTPSGVGNYVAHREMLCDAHQLLPSDLTRINARRTPFHFTQTKNCALTALVIYIWFTLWYFCVICVE